MKKVKAFTVLEMILALAISAIVITGAFTLYRMIFIQWVQYRTLTGEVYETVNMERLLKEDAAACTHMYVTHSGLRCSWEDRSVVYSVQDSFVVREAGRLDTFYVGSCQSETFFNNKPVSDSALVDQVNLLFIKGEDSNFIYIQKQYVSDELFRLKQ